MPGRATKNHTAEVSMRIGSCLEKSTGRYICYFMSAAPLNDVNSHNPIVRNLVPHLVLVHVLHIALNVPGGGPRPT